jgi:septal ring factor EnvC (AmiA/AmiB activator)
MTQKRIVNRGHLQRRGAACLRLPCWRLSFVLIVVALALSSPPATAQSGDTAKQRATELKQLRARIKQLQQELNQTADLRDAEREELQRLDDRIGILVNAVRELDQEQRAQTSRLQKLKGRQRQVQRDLKRQRQGLVRHVRAAYAMGQQEYMKLLLNQDDPAAVGRVMAYYGYLGRARSQQIATTRVSLTELAQLEQQIAERTGELRKLRAAQMDRKRALVEVYTQRSQVLAALDRKVHGQTEEITRLRSAERRLQRLLDQLRTHLADIPGGPASERRFRNAKGKLPFPTQGRILVRYGEPKRGRQLRWKGVLVGGDVGQDVISVARGRVAFADWLRGFGLLLILEHGDGYMTLYGHNQGLYAQVGDWVDTGQVIASLGNTGDVPQPGVYFEIRREGQPRDPLGWLRRR